MTLTGHADRERVASESHTGFPALGAFGAGPLGPRVRLSAHPLVSGRSCSRALPFLIVITAITAISSVTACTTAPGASTTATSTPATQTQPKPVVIVSTSILGDIARNVIGDAASVEVLIPPNTEPRGFKPSAEQIDHMQSADLIIVNGLDLEKELQPSLEVARAKNVALLEIGPQLNPIPLGGSETGTRNTVSNDGPLDPHVWLDPDRMAQAGHLMSAAVAKLGVRADALDERARGYAEQLARASEEIEDSLAAIPDERRQIWTYHDTMAYFADKYGFTIVGVLVPDPSQTEPGDEPLVDLSKTTSGSSTPPIFTETSDPSTLADTLSARAGGKVEVVAIHVHSLGLPGSGADTYIGLITSNARLIARTIAP